MTIRSGTRLGSHEIAELLGKGGMGEVFRARDTKLKRAVAIKILPAEFLLSSDRVSRFQREAEVLASLNHPNIAAIHSLEESGDTRFLVLELVEGETLAERIERGPVPFDDAIHIARSICDALEAAHDKGIVHRDLKPANVKLTPEGNVKVLDFGLAKAMEGTTANPVRSDAPTMGMEETNTGVILGTVAYMAPEQAKGKPVDRRADIWAFGVVLFELLTGRRTFSGETASETIAAVLMQEADWKALPAETPGRIRELLRRCLVKDPRSRLQAIGEARLVLSGPLENPVLDPSHDWTGRLGWAISSLLSIALGVLAFVHFREAPAKPPSLRFQISPPGSAAATFVALSPDGRNLAFVAEAGGSSQLWLRPLDALDSRTLPGTEGASYPFWSPDGTQLAFFQEGKLKKIVAAGGPIQILCDAPSPRGGAWNRDGLIVFSPSPAGELVRVSDTGGAVTPVVQLAQGDRGLRFPAFLPDGAHFLYNATSEQSGVMLGALDQTAPTHLLSDFSNAFYTPPATGRGPGFLLFRRDGNLMAQSFDVNSLKTAGSLFPLVENVADGQHVGLGEFSVSDSGTLVYRIANPFPTRELVWVDRAGKRLAVVSKPDTFDDIIALSPDEKAVAVGVRSGNAASYLWLQDLSKNGVLSRFTFNCCQSEAPIWSPDSSHLVFNSTGNGPHGLRQKNISGGAEKLLHAGTNTEPSDWSGDGKLIAYTQTGQKTQSDLWLVPTHNESAGSQTPIPYLQTPYNENNGRFSPNGQWISYVSNASGQPQLYVDKVPSGGAKRQITTSGVSAELAFAPAWNRDGTELYYAAGGKLMAISMNLTTAVEHGPPRELFSLQGIAGYAASRDGQRFLVVANAGKSPPAVPPITVITNWTSAFHEALGKPKQK